MRLLAFLKMYLKSLVKEFPSFLLSYAIYPIVIALIVGYAQKDMFTPVINEPIFSIIIEDEDHSEESRNLISFLNSEEISKVIVVKSNEEEKFDYTLYIPKGYEESLLGQKSASVKVVAEDNSPSSLGNLFVNIIHRYNKEKSQGLIISKSIESKFLEDESSDSSKKEAFIGEISGILNKAYTTDSINTNIYNVRKSLNSYEFYSITFLSFAFIIFIMSVIASDAIEKENGLYSRIISTAITKIQYFNYGLMSNYVMMIIANLIYVFAYRISGLSFKGSLWLLLLIVLVQSLMITVIGTLMSILFKKKYGIPLIQLFLIVQMVSSTVTPLTKFNKSPILNLLSKYRPDTLIANTYRNYLVYNEISSITNYLWIILGMSLVFYIISLLAIKLDWGIKR